MRLGGRVVMQRTANPCTSVRFRPQPPNLFYCVARVAKLVDARDLKSLGTYPPVPVRPRPRAPSYLDFKNICSKSHTNWARIDDDKKCRQILLNLSQRYIAPSQAGRQQITSTI